MHNTVLPVSTWRNQPNSLIKDLKIDYISGQESEDWIETCYIGNSKVDFKLDSRSQADILPERCLHKTGLALLPSNASLKSHFWHHVKLSADTQP